LIVFTS